jgi:antitoxin MazE
LQARRGYARNITNVVKQPVTQAILGRWGKSVALRLPQEITNKLNLHEGEVVDINAGPDTIVIRRARPSYSIDELFAGKSPEEWRALYADAYDWGPDLGREIVEE